MSQLLLGTMKELLRICNISERNKVSSKVLFRKKILILSTSPFIVNIFFNDHICFLSKSNNITVLTPQESFPSLKMKSDSYKYINFEIARKISIFKDLKSFFVLLTFLLFNRFDLIICLGPKAGLIGIFTGFLCGIKKRLFIFQGEVWANKKGIDRYFLKFFDRCIVNFATHLLAVSQNEKEYLFRENVDINKKIKVLGKGSIAGVSLNQVNADKHEIDRELKKLQIPKKSKICLYIGRLTRDKGLLDLAEAFNRIADKCNLYLLIVGPDEENIKNEFKRSVNKHIDKVRFIPYTSNITLYFSLSYFVVLPSYREGLPQSILEAFSFAKPVIASDIYGIRSLVKNKYNGLLFKARNIDELAKLLIYMNNIPIKKYRIYCKNSYKFVSEYYNKEKVIKLYSEYFNYLLKQ